MTTHNLVPKVIICLQMLILVFSIYFLEDFDHDDCLLQCGNYDTWKQPVLRYRSLKMLMYPTTLAVKYNCQRMGYNVEVEPAVFVDDGTWMDKLYKGQVWYTIDHPDSTEKIKDVIPGLNELIMYKAALLSRGGKYIPKGFHMPQQKEEFLRYFQEPENKKKRWIQKSPIHQGNKVTNVYYADLQRINVIQEYVGNPFLIDGRKFSIGVHIAFPSAGPLRVYILDYVVSLRFCAKDYYPEDLTDTATYVCDGMELNDIKFIGQVDAFRSYYFKHEYTVRKAFEAYVKEMGRDPATVFPQIYDAVRDVFNGTAGLVGEHGDTNTKYYEVTRWDFILDDDFKIYLMEANFSPALSAKERNGVPAYKAHYFESTVYNMFRVMGLEDLHDFQNVRPSYIIRDYDVEIGDEVCYSESCTSCNMKKCRLCSHCLSPKHRKMLKTVFWEHLKRGQTRLVYPVQKYGNDTPESYYDWQTDDNKLTADWLHAKCKRDIYWCN